VPSPHRFFKNSSSGLHSYCNNLSNTKWNQQKRPRFGLWLAFMRVHSDSTLHTPLHISRCKNSACHAPTHHVLRAHCACARRTSVPRDSLRRPRVVDTDTDPDPSFFLIVDPDPGCDDQKLKKIYSWKKKIFLIKNCNLLILKGAQAWDIRSLGFSWFLHHKVSMCGRLRG
jgi:hypothetical protein